jgi:hypothetical protein
MKSKNLDQLKNVVFLNKIWFILILTIIISTITIRFAEPISDSDFWWQLLYGKYLLKHGTLIPDHTIYSWLSTDNSTIYCAWISEIIFYLLFKAGGLNTIFAFRYFCIFLFLFSIWHYARQLKIERHPFVWLITIITILMAYCGTYIKPEIFTFLFIILTCWNWWTIRINKEKALINCYFFPALILIWVNTHGGFIFGILFIVVAFAGEYLNKWLSPDQALPKPVRKRLLIALALSIIAIFCTPYGIDYPVQLLLGCIPTQENISKFLAVGSFKSPVKSAFEAYLHLGEYGVISAIILISLIIKVHKAGKTDWSLLLSNLVFAILYTRMIRTSFYWAPIFIFSSLHMLSQVQFSLWTNNKKAKFTTTVIICLLTLVIGLRANIEALTNPPPDTYPGFGKGSFNPVEEAEIIKTNLNGLKIGNTYNQGGYLLWELWPENKIFIDARHFPFKNSIKEYLLFINGKNTDTYLKNHPCDIWCIGLSETGLNSWFLNSPEWKLYFYGSNAAIYLRKDLNQTQMPSLTGSGINKLQTIALFQKVVLFAEQAKDWQSIEKLIQNIQEQSWWPNQSSEVQAILNYATGALAFKDNKFHESIKLLEKTPREHSFRNNQLLALSYMALLTKTWKDNDYHVTLDYLNQVNLAWPNNGYYLYNSAVVQWHLNRIENKQINGKKLNSWKKNLLIIKEHTPINQETRKYLDITNAILNNTYQEKPELWVPRQIQELTAQGKK